jgi:hypothetical protein
MLATTLMNESFIAKKALEACLMISAFLNDVTMNLAGFATLQAPGIAPCRA